MRACSSISITPAKLIGAWVADYNTGRPHSSLGYKTPAAYADTLTAPKGVTLAEALIVPGMKVQWQVNSQTRGQPERTAGNFRGGFKADIRDFTVGFWINDR
jgi:hypothetical protein